MDSDISYVNRFLKGYSPQHHLELLMRHPKATAYLKADGIALGDSESSVARDAVETMLESVDDVSSAAISYTLNRLQTNRKIELAASLLALFTSGGVVGSIIGLDEKYLAAGLGALGLSGALLTLLVKWQKGGVSGPLDLEKSFDKLREYNWNARELAAKLKRTDTEEELQKIVSASNDLARNIYMLLGGLGYEADVRPL